MKKIFNTVLAFAALAVIGIFASCKAQEVYYGTPEASDFEFGDNVVVKTTTKVEIANPSGYYKVNTDAATKESEPYVSMKSTDPALFYDKVEYSVFVPIIEETKNGGYFDYRVESSDYVNVHVEKVTGGIKVEWTYKEDLNPNDDDDEDNVNKVELKDKDGNTAYSYDSYDYLTGKTKYKPAEITSSYKKPNVSSVDITVTATDRHDSSNQITKAITVSYSTSATKEVVEYERSW